MPVKASLRLFGAIWVLSSDPDSFGLSGFLGRKGKLWLAEFTHQACLWNPLIFFLPLLTVKEKLEQVAWQEGEDGCLHWLLFGSVLEPQSK